MEVTELGEIVAGARPGRRSSQDVTVVDLTGTGVQDTAIATLARDRARAANAGTVFES
jgi:ornithine cyclodeaminase